MSDNLFENTHSSLDGVLAFAPLAPYLIGIMAVVALWKIIRSIATISVIKKLSKAESAGIYKNDSPEITGLNLKFAKCTLIINLSFFAVILVVSYIFYTSLHA
ncbi:hypothetical protein VBK20_25525 [Enterobacter hormaechei]|nr:hypothetical protein [Enterobacter hormaechei]